MHPLVFFLLSLCLDDGCTGQKTRGCECFASSCSKTVVGPRGAESLIDSNKHMIPPILLKTIFTVALTKWAFFAVGDNLNPVRLHTQIH